MNEALADPNWLRERLSEVKRGEIRTVEAWVHLALDRVNLFVRWTEVESREDARALERTCIKKPSPIWNRYLVNPLEEVEVS